MTDNPNTQEPTQPPRDLKNRINLFLREMLPDGVTLREAGEVAVEFHNRIWSLWGARR